jgi:hypothetical protein
MNHEACGLVVPLLSIPPAFAADPSLRVDYEGFTVWLNCQEHAVFKFRYNAQRDSNGSTFLLTDDFNGPALRPLAIIAPIQKSYAPTRGADRYAHGHCEPVGRLTRYH